MNSSKLVLDAWYDKLNGAISVPVYKRVPEDAPDNYVQLRVEGTVDSTNKRSFNDEVTIVTDITTTFKNVGDDSVMEGIDSEIVSLVMTSPGQNSLTATGLQILNIRRDQQYLELADKVNVYLRKISRYSHHIHQI